MAPPAGAAFPGANGKIAYAKQSSHHLADIFTIDPDGTGRTRLTNTKKVDADPAWSADGLRIAFWHGVDGDLRVMDADGSNVSTVLTIDDMPGTYFFMTDPEWSPDGTMLAFSALNGDTFKWRVFTVGIDG